MHDGPADDHRLHRRPRTLPFSPPRPYRRLLERSGQSDSELRGAQGVAAEEWRGAGCLKAACIRPDRDEPAKRFLHLACPELSQSKIKLGRDWYINNPTMTTKDRNTG